MNSFRFIRFSWQLFLPVFQQAAGAILLGSMTVLAAIGLIGTSTYLISYAALQPSIAVLQVAIIGVRFFGISRSVFRYLERITSHSVNLRMVARLRLWFYEKVEKLVPAAMSQYDSGDLLDRVLQDVGVLEQFFIRVIAPPIVALMVIAVTTLFMFSLNVVLGWSTLWLLLVAAWIILALSIYLHRNQQKRYADSRSRLHTQLISLVDGNADIRVNGHLLTFLELLNVKQTDYSRLQRISTRTVALLNALVSIFAGLAMMVVFMEATKLTRGGELDGRLISVGALLVLASFEVFISFPQAGLTLTQSDQSIDRLLDISERKPETSDPMLPVVLTDFQSLDITNLQFSYPCTGQQLFENLSLHIETGQRVALVGPSGAGKTSLVNLLLGFWQYQSGSISINGQELERYTRSDLRNLIRVSIQKPFFFPGSIRQNLLLANPDATEEDLHRALAMAQCGEWLGTLPGGLDAEIGERGNRVSEGQRKRLDLARTLLADSPFVILDEPFAGIDELTGSELLLSIIPETPVKTLLIITHQLTSLDYLDHIFFLDGGRIVESGNHQELMKLSGRYARMYRLQKGMINETGWGQAGAGIKPLTL